MNDSDYIYDPDAAFSEAERRIRKALDEDSEALDLAGFGLDRLPDSLRHLLPLKKLDLSKNRLIRIPTWLAELALLRSLNLADNKLRVLPESFGKLFRLYVLDLSNNRLTEAPGFLQKLTRLELLFMGGNKVSGFPTFATPALVQVVNLSGNRLDSLPESIGELKMLNCLNLKDNRLTRLPESLRKLTALRKLYLHGNALGVPNELLGPSDVETPLRKARSPKKILDSYFRNRIPLVAREKRAQSHVAPLETAMHIRKSALRFDFGISFSGANRKLARRVRDGLRNAGFSVFFDEDYEHEMLGNDGSLYLRNIYSRNCRFCVVLISRSYDKRTWSNLEREAIQSREIRGETGSLIPVAVEEYHPSWLPETRIRFDLWKRSIPQLIVILSKLCRPLDPKRSMRSRTNPSE